MEITIPKCIIPWFDKYKGANKLLSFSDKICSENGFLKSIYRRLKEIATIANVKKYHYLYLSSFIRYNSTKRLRCFNRIG